MITPIRQGRKHGRILVTLALFALAGLTGASAHATTPTIDWVARYTGLGNGNNQATDMAVDAQGCVYVTGYSSGLLWDIATVKYGPAGNELHAVRYNGAPGGDDVPWAIAVDPLGDVYVAGYSAVATAFNFDFITIKYDSTLTQQWVRVYSGLQNLGGDVAYDVQADALGNVYATGSSFAASTSDDMVTIKYNAAGVLKWVKRFDGIGHSGDSGNAIRVDENGFVYITGITQRSSSAGNMDMTTIKYDPDGVQQWARTLNGSNNTNDGGIALDLDGSGNVYVAGYATGIGTAFDFTTVKYDADGNQQWLRTYDPIHGNDSAHALVVDVSGNIYVTGLATTSGIQSDYATIGYDTDGNQLWLRTYDGPVGGFDEAQSVTADEAGSVYVTGYSDGGNNLVNYDYATIKYKADGTLEWVDRYNGTGDNIDVAAKVALDGEDNVIVSGWSTGTHNTDVDFTTIKYDQGGATALPGGLPALRNMHISAWPNPFMREVLFSFHLPAPSPVDLTLYDIGGRRVRTVLHGWLGAGEQQAELSGAGIAAGIYLYRLQAGPNEVTGKIIRW